MLVSTQSFKIHEAGESSHNKCDNETISQHVYSRFFVDGSNHA